MEKSYSDFAKELGGSKQKLNYYVNDENKEKIFIKKGNKDFPYRIKNFWKNIKQN